ncbi:MAG: HEAT repeat domain-containing protein [Planctomycetota bacterium]
MKHGRTFFQIFFAAFFCLTAGVVNAMTLDEAFKKLETHKFGQNHQVLDFLREAAVTSHSDRTTRKKLNDGFTRIVNSETPYDARQFACRQLVLTATEEHIPALTRHLGDEKMTHMALYVLTHIDSPEVDKALLSALDEATGKARLGIMHMLGNRRCADSVKPLARLMVSGDEETSIAAIRALGHIGTTEAHTQFRMYDDHPPSKHSHAKTMALAHADLDFADRFLAEGDKAQATRRYQSAFDKDNPPHVRAAGLKGLAVSMGARAEPLIAQSLGSDSRQLQGMAAMIVRTIPENKTAELFAAGLPELEPRVQVLLINALAARADGAGITLIETACKEQDASVRQVALVALGRIGDESCVPLLIEHGDVDSLTNLKGENVNAALIEGLAEGESAEKVTICRALLARDAVEAAPALIEAARTGGGSLRAEAIKALHSLAGRRQMSALVDLIFTVEPAEADQVGKALVAVARRNSVQRECTQDILSKYDKAAGADHQIALLLTLGQLGDERALPILREGLQDDRGQIRYAAIKALNAWPDAAPAGDLLEVAESAEDPTHRVLALRGFIELVDAADLPSDEKLVHYRQAMQAARQDAERKKVLSVLAGLGTLDGFQMAVSHLDNPSLENEAALTACRIAQNIRFGENRPGQRSRFDKAAGSGNSPQDRPRQIGSHLQELIKVAQNGMACEAPRFA